MRVGIFFAAGDRELAEEVASQLSDSDLRVISVQIRENAGSGKRRRRRSMDDVLHRVTHVVLILSSRSISARWLSYVAGYCSGSRKSTCIYQKNRVSSVPVYLKTFPLFSEAGKLRLYFRERMLEWFAWYEKAKARRSILQADLCLNADTLASCVAEGNIAAVENFLKAGFSPDTKNRKGVPLLALAVRNDHRLLVEFLLKAGADINTVSGDRENTALMDASVTGNREILEDLISAGADLDAQSRDGQTALVLAVGNGCIESAEVLLRAGADPHVADRLGMTARKYAELFRHSDILTALDNEAYAGE